MASIKKNNEQERALALVNKSILEITKYDEILTFETNEISVNISSKGDANKVKIDLSPYEKDIKIIIQKAKKAALETIKRNCNKYDIELDDKEKEIIATKM